ncbi:MAG: patatin-like phospholipase family protein [Deltaproteobacteria bacterium]|nr:patatin-like phospholipase family protein [Deltaproteobacteria bacterium]
MALVLAGGAARGAYEVGVIQYLFEDVSHDLGRDVPLDILCGTSVGAINACALAAMADDPRRVQRMIKHWTELRVGDVVRADPRAMLAMVRGLFGSKNGGDEHARRGGILDPAGLTRIIASSVPFNNIDENLRAGRIHALTVSTTHVATGRTVVFVQRADPGLPEWSHDPTIIPRATRIRAEHALASAAIPFLFPAVRIDGEFHCDGGLRQNVPLSPARRLGASGLIVINPRHVTPAVEAPIDHHAPFPGPLFLLGKTMNALLLDRIDNDMDRLDRITSILDAGERAYGPGFVDKINEELGYPRGKGIRPLRTVLIRASQDIGRLSADFVRSVGFRKRARGLVGRFIRTLADGDPSREADLLSYLLFDGEFARQLIELGRADARAHHAELCASFADHEAQ